MHGRTLYVAVGIGDAILPGPPMSGIAFGNPSPSSPLFSSVLAVHVGPHVEKWTRGFRLTLSDQQKLARGFPVLLANSWTDWILLHRVADFPDYIPAPRPDAPDNVRGSNPFDLVGLGARLYVTDGGRNLVWKVEIFGGATSIHTEFPALPNTFTPPPPPFLDAVPTGIAVAGSKLLVTLFRGFPFPVGSSVVQAVDIATGAQEAFITNGLTNGLRTAIDVRQVRQAGWEIGHLVLIHSDAAALPNPFAGPGRLLWYEDPADTPTEVPSCLARPTSLVLDPWRRVLYVTELVTGRVVRIRLDS
jgi:hypothetical protein